jgi:SH3-like domain-containing protein
MLFRTEAFARFAFIAAVSLPLTTFAQTTAPAAAGGARGPDMALVPGTVHSALVNSTPATMPATAPATAPMARAGTSLPPAAELPAITEAFVATVTDNRVNVRSGAGTAYYEIGQLGKGDLVYVVGSSKDWYKILPPNGMFCMIAKEFVEADAGGISGGTVKGDYINVRAGSAVSKRDPSAVVAVVRKGTHVRILGSTDTYYEIAPPDQAYVYVSAQYIKPAGGVDYKVPDLKLPAGISGPAVATVDAPTTKPAVAAVGPVEVDGSSAADAGHDKPIETPGMAATPTPAPSAAIAPAVTFSAAATARYNDAHARHVEEAKKPLADRDTAGLMREFQDILTLDNLSPTVKIGSQADIKSLEQEATLQRLMKEQAAAAEVTRKQSDALREQYEASQKILASVKQIEPYVDEGVLKSSNVVAGKYALVNPDTGRTVAYVDPAASAIDVSIFLNKYIGVHGDKKKAADSDLEIISVRDATLMAAPYAAQ